MAVYVVHYCKNNLKLKNGKEITRGRLPGYSDSALTCTNAFIDEDIAPRLSTKYPPIWKYCPECEEKGFTSILPPPNKAKSERIKRIHST